MKKNYIKITLDLFMFLFVILFYNKHTVSMNFHEIGGLIICCLFLIHIGINSRWLYSISKRLFKKELSIKARIVYVIDFLLLLNFSLIVLSGIMISKTILTSISGNDVMWRNIHYFSAGLSIIFLGIHLGLHLPFIKCMTKKIVSIPQKISMALLTIFMAITLAFGSYSIVNSNFLELFTYPFVETHGEHNGKNQGKYKNSPYNISEKKLRNKNRSTHQVNFNNVLIEGATYGSIIITIAFLTSSTEKIIKRRI